MPWKIGQILLANGALFVEGRKRGHAQDDQNISFNTIQTYRTGERILIFPIVFKGGHDQSK